MVSSLAGKQLAKLAFGKNRKKEKKKFPQNFKTYWVVSHGDLIQICHAMYIIGGYNSKSYHDLSSSILWSSIEWLTTKINMSLL